MSKDLPRSAGGGLSGRQCHPWEDIPQDPVYRKQSQYTVQKHIAAWYDLHMSAACRADQLAVEAEQDDAQDQYRGIVPQRGQQIPVQDRQHRPGVAAAGAEQPRCPSPHAVRIEPACRELHNGRLHQHCRCTEQRQ